MLRRGQLLTQAEADWLMSMSKEIRRKRVRLPGAGRNVSIVVMSQQTGRTGRTERFYLDVNRGKRDPRKYTLQLRCRHTVVLRRLDVESGPHKNPDKAPTRQLHALAGQRIESPQLHFYIEGHDDQWAKDASDIFINVDDMAATWTKFLGHCNVTNAPSPQGGLL